MTLTELLPHIRQLQAEEKLRLIRILAEDLDQTKPAVHLDPHAIYELPTPYNSFGVAEQLARELGRQPDGPE